MAKRTAPSQATLLFDGKECTDFAVASRLGSWALDLGQGGLVLEQDVPCGMKPTGAWFAFRPFDVVDRLLRDCAACGCPLSLSAERLSAQVMSVASAGAALVEADQGTSGIQGAVRMTALLTPADTHLLVRWAPLGDAQPQPQDQDQAQPRAQAAPLTMGFSSWRTPEDFNDLDCRGGSVRFAMETEARRLGLDGMIALDSAGQVRGSTRGEVFTIRDGVLVAGRPQAGSGLAGEASLAGSGAGPVGSVMRESLLSLGLDLDIPVLEGPLGRSGVYDADAVLVLDRMGGLTQVASVDGRPVGRALGAAARKKACKPVDALVKAWMKVMEGTCREFADWAVALEAVKRSGS